MAKKTRVKNAVSKPKVAMIGYGSQGRALALNLRDSGYKVIIGLRSRSKSRKVAESDKFKKITTPGRATAESNIVCFALPDHDHGRVYARYISGNLKTGATLLFLHGMSIHFRFITPPDHCDVVLIAPHAPGVAVRDKFLGDRSISAFYAVAQNRSGNAKTNVIALAESMGFAKKRLIETTFEHEALGDIFGEQAVLCGGLASLIKSGFEVLVENGLKPESAYLEVAYQLDLIIDLVKQHGIEGMLKRISVAARYGSVQNGPRVIGPQVKKQMQKVFAEIKSGRFPSKLASLKKEDITELNEQTRSLTRPDLEKAAKKFSK